MRRALAAVVLATAIVLGTGGVAQARPVLDPPGPVYCGPGQSYTIFDVSTGGLVTHCLPYVYVPHRVKWPLVWYKPWTWFHR